MKEINKEAMLQKGLKQLKENLKKDNFIAVITSDELLIFDVPVLETFYVKQDENFSDFMQVQQNFLKVSEENLTNADLVYNILEDMLITEELGKTMLLTADTVLSLCRHLFRVIESTVSDENIDVETKNEIVSSPLGLFVNMFTEVLDPEQIEPFVRVSELISATSTEGEVTQEIADAFSDNTTDVIQ